MQDPTKRQDNCDSNHPGLDANTASGGMIDAGISAVDTVLSIVKEVGEMLDGVPYVKALSGVVLKFIKIRDEIKSNKARCAEIINKVLRMSKTIYDKLSEIANSGGRVQTMLAKIKMHLEDYERTLTGIFAALEKYRGRRTIARYLNRDLDELNALDRRLDELKDTLFLHILFDIKHQQASSAPTAQIEKSSVPPNSVPASLHPEHILPPKPSLMVERDSQLNELRNILLSLDSSRIIILGGGGFGKTTLARWIMHDPEINGRYQKAYFLSCEGVTSTEALLLSIGSTLGITAAPSAILASARGILQATTTLLCFDNFETPWEPSATRAKVEDVLAYITDIPNLSLLVTMRGEQRPAKVMWTHPLLPPLSTLSLQSAQKILQTIAPNHQIDADTERILGVIDGIPLGITLIANLLRDGETSHSLWKRWSKEHTRIVENGGDTRESNLDASISLSVYSPRMVRDPEAVKLLAALSLLPDGFYTEAIEELEEDLHIGEIHRPLQTLRAVALIKNEPTSSRIQLLSPIRLFCHHFLLSEVATSTDSLIDYYISILRRAKYRVSDPDHFAKVVPELRNIHSLIQRGFTAGYSGPLIKLVKGTCYLTDWSLYTGYSVEETIRMATERSADLPNNNAECYMMLGKLYRWEGRFESAEDCFRKAATGFSQQNNSIGEAQVLQFLFGVLRSRNRGEQMEHILQRSLELYHQSNNLLGIATVQKDLGWLYSKRSKYPEAEASLKNALSAFQEIPDLVGEANTYIVLAEMSDKQSKLGEAEQYANDALRVASLAQYAAGKGNALYYLSRLAITSDRVQEASRLCGQAYEIYKQINDSIGELNTANNLGSIYIQQDRLSSAVTILTTAIGVAPEIIQKAMLVFTLGRAYLCGNHLEKAEAIFEDARRMFEKFKNIIWQADILSQAASINLERNRIDEAERKLESILNLGVWKDVEMKRLCMLGNIYIRKGRLDDAESSLKAALAFAQEEKCSYQQGNIFRSVGSLRVEQGCIDEAVQAYREAFKLHCKAQWISEQATDMKQLAKAYELKGNVDEAQTAYKDAEKLMAKVKDTRDLGVFLAKH
ncbi:TPR-like protein [Pholiota conissans]|uniref:TPR-like protein n=1 Tax=Pholiota conissans TaxID=109636 RepID=A0A9P6CPW9_9AGAR|nr:TPR-like protein [Pholiota conissans]